MHFLIVCNMLTVAPIPHDGRLVLAMAIPLSGWLIVSALRDRTGLALIIWAVLTAGIVIVGRMIYF